MCIFYKQYFYGFLFMILGLITTKALVKSIHTEEGLELLFKQRTRRSNIPSITNECCTKVGCTWEEYAEYCPSNKRRNHY
uniref:Insulin-like domain-containing protein n=1 Tax=Glossina austeni TaxID=7395 RepID=A0A1A9UQE7_GLOAU